MVAHSDYSVLSCVMKQAGPPLIKGPNRITNLGNRTEPQDQMAGGRGGRKRERGIENRDQYFSSGQMQFKTSF